MVQPSMDSFRTSSIISGNITSVLIYMLTQFDLNLAIHIGHVACHSITGGRDCYYDFT